jgi:hypothetical protein
MPCYTVVKVKLDDDQITRKARKALGYPPKGDLLPDAAAVEKARKALGLSRYADKRLVEARAAQAVQAEAKILTSIAKVRKLQPTAVIKRKGNKLTVKVSV